MTGCQMGYAPLGKPLMSVICYYVDGLLIDTGAHNANRSFQKMTNHLSIDQVTLTHYHEDHSGNARYIQNTRNVPIYGHPLTVEKMAHGFTLKPYEHYMWGAAKPVRLEPIPACIETNQYIFEYYHTPGHAEDHLVYLEKNNGWLFSGDMFLATRIKYFRKDECLATLIDSLKRIEQLDFDTVFCGHNPQLKNGKAMIRKKLKYLQSFRDSIYSLLEKGMTTQEVCTELCHKEDRFTLYFTLGDVSFKNMVLSAIHSFEQEIVDNI